VYAWLPEHPFESVAVIVMLVLYDAKLYVPVIVPLLLFNTRPTGSPPAVTLYVYGDAPPLATTVWLYGAPIETFGSVFGETVIVGQLTTMLKFEELEQSVALLSVTDTVKVAVPEAVGVPVTWPALFIVNPAGRPPPEIAKVNGEVPPVAANVWL
jgi:hypothetical protein